MTTTTQPAAEGLLDLVTLCFGSEEDAALAAEGASWALAGDAPDDDATVERTGTTIRAWAAGAADRVAQFIIDLSAAGAPVRRVEVCTERRSAGHAGS
jgi:hypothetical protein